MYPYCNVLVGLVWSDDSDSYAGATVAIGRAIRARQVYSNEPDKNRHPCPPAWGLVVELTTLSHKKNKLLHNRFGRMQTGGEL
jgi:hypothetical protein